MGDGVNETYFLPLNGGAKQTLGKGSVLGVSDNGRFAAIHDGTTLTVGGQTSVVLR